MQRALMFKQITHVTSLWC